MKLYEGEWFCSKPHGNGVLFWENGLKQYDGEWEDGKYHGKGTLYYENGVM
jgi:hypothetical protein